MNDIETETARLLTAIAVTADLWSRVDVRSLAVRRGDLWRNLLTILTLSGDEETGSPDEETFAETQHLLAVRQRWLFEEFRALLESIRSGRTMIGGREIAFLSAESENAPLAPYSYAFAHTARMFGDAPPIDGPTFGHTLLLSGQGTYYLLDHLRGGRDELDAELRGAAVPWDGLDAVLRFGMRTRRRVDTQNPAVIVVNAPLDVRIDVDSSTLRNGKLRVGLKTRNGNARSHVSVGFTASTKAGLGDRGSTSPLADSWTQSDGEWTASTVAQAGDGVQAAVFARVGPYVVDRAAIIDAAQRVNRPLIQTYETIDPGLGVLGKWLQKPDPTEQVEFERAVARVLLFCGFYVDGFAGDKRLSNAPDVIAYSREQRTLLIVECTTASLQSRDGKLSRLVLRANEVAMALSEDATPNLRIAIATPLLRANLPQADRDAAQSDSIAILDQAALAALLAIARSGAGARAALEIIAQSVNEPRSSEDSLSLFGRDDLD